MYNSNYICVNDNVHSWEITSPCHEKEMKIMRTCPSKIMMSKYQMWFSISEKKSAVVRQWAN